MREAGRLHAIKQWWALAVLALVVLPSPAAAGPRCSEDAMIVFDSSASMQHEDAGGVRLDVARAAARSVLPELTAGLVTYGSGPICDTVRTQLAPRLNNSSAISSALDRLKPNGQTPLTQGLMRAAQMLGGGGMPATIVLVTDGEENCGGNACVFAAALRSEHKALRVHVIGFKMPSEPPPMLACLTDMTGGRYVAASNVSELKAALKEALDCPNISDAAPGTRDDHARRMTAIVSKMARPQLE
jgi:Ca-activated chloride channel family protein